MDSTNRTIETMKFLKEKLYDTGRGDTLLYTTLKA